MNKDSVHVDDHLDVSGTPKSLHKSGLDTLPPGTPPEETPRGERENLNEPEVTAVVTRGIDLKLGKIHHSDVKVEKEIKVDSSSSGSSE